MLNFIRWAAAAACAVALVAGNAAAETIRVAVPIDATTFDPHFATDKTTISINDHMFEGLLRRDPQGNVIPALAESWELADDQLTWTYRLRKDVRFTDGTPFDAAAAKTSLDRVLDPKTGAGGRARLSGIESVTVIDSHTLQIRTKYPWPDLQDGLAANSTVILSPRALEQHGKQVSRNPVGTGPFKLEAHNVGSEVVLARNDDYWGGKPAYDKLVISVVPEAAARSSLIQVGQVDVAVTVDPEMIPALEKNGGVEVSIEPSTFSVFYMFNMRKKPMDDARVRRAINLAIDREAIVKSLLGPAGDVTRNFFAHGVQYRKDLAPVPYDPKAARELLREAGHGSGLELKIWAAHRYVKDQQVAEAIQAYLRQVGVNASIDMADWGSHWARINKEQKDADLYLLATTIPEPTFRTEWNFGRGAGKYASGYGDEDFWKTLEAASRTIDSDKRGELFGQIQERIWTDLPYLFLFDRKLISAVRKDVTGFVMDPREVWTAVGASRKK